MNKAFSETSTKALVVAITLVFCFGLLEIGLRVTGRFQGNSLQGFFAPGRTCYRLERNTSKTIHWPASSWTVNTDQLGFRCAKPGVRDLAAKPYYAVLGSSETFGDGLNYEDTFIGVMAHGLAQQGIEVVNMAVGGHELDVQNELFHEYISSAKQRPEKVFICLNPRVISEFDEHHERVVVRSGYLFSKNGWKRAYIQKALESDLGVYCFFRDAVRNYQASHFNRRDFDLSFYYETYSTTNRIHSAERTAEFLAHLKELESYIRSLNATPICVYNPLVGGFEVNKLRAQGRLPKGDLDTEFFPELVQKHCQEEGIQLIDTEPLLQKMYDEGKTLNIELDGHYNAATSKVVGEFMCEALKTGQKELVRKPQNHVTAGEGASKPLVLNKK